MIIICHHQALPQRIPQPSTKPDPLYLIKDPLYRSLGQLAKRFGPILYLQFGSWPVSVVSCPAAIEDCLAKSDVTLANRPCLLAGKSGGYDYASITWAPYGDHWRNLRRISSLELLSSYRLQLLSSMRASEVKSFVKKLFQASTNSEDRMIEMKSAFFENEDVGWIIETEEARKYRDKVERSFRGGGSALVLEHYFPILRWFSGLESKFKKFHEVNDRFVRGIIDERRKMLNDEAALGVKKATIDVLLWHWHNSGYTGVGIDTCTQQARSPILEKAQPKIDEKVGHDRLLPESDIEHLPYLHCIIMETVRMYPAGPLAFHSSSAD
ncbi:LOW QUALITY PROTEIN: hypothetical protein Cgig2_003236 [Carnegiea gigantea]|uniref:Cytochrome P450 n=1 Tax=Carnegiea gigantea TaxID=171969 RepID=A0A9Q1JTN1_9CARY|nr:LOW QUALITY PROTEIN: hypothetical protein Cgig2_003236 [Carnegiea gigantea]